MNCAHTRQSHGVDGKWRCKRCRRVVVSEAKEGAPLAASSKKRGSHKYDTAPTRQSMTDAIQSAHQKYGSRIHRGHLERVMWANSVGAESQTKFAELQESGREQIRQIMNPNNNKYFKVANRPAEEAAPKATKPAEEAKRD